MIPTIRKSYIKKSPPAGTLCPSDLEKFLSRRHNPSWFFLPPRAICDTPRTVSPLVPRPPTQEITCVLSKLNFKE